MVIPKRLSTVRPASLGAGAGPTLSPRAGAVFVWVCDSCTGGRTPAPDETRIAADDHELRAGVEFTVDRASPRLVLSEPEIGRMETVLSGLVPAPDIAVPVGNGPGVRGLLISPVRYADGQQTDLLVTPKQAILGPSATDPMAFEDAGSLYVFLRSIAAHRLDELTLDGIPK